MTVKVMRKLALDAEILFTIKDICLVNLFDWYLYYKLNDPKFSQACDYLSSIHCRGQRYRKALKQCRETFQQAYQSDSRLGKQHEIQ